MLLKYCLTQIKWSCSNDSSWKLIAQFSLLQEGPKTQADITPGPETQADIIPGPETQADMIPGPETLADITPGPESQADIRMRFDAISPFTVW